MALVLDVIVLLTIFYALIFAIEIWGLNHKDKDAQKERVYLYGQYLVTLGAIGSLLGIFVYEQSPISQLISLSCFVIGLTVSAYLVYIRYAKQGFFDRTPLAYHWLKRYMDRRDKEKENTENKGENNE